MPGSPMIGTRLGPYEIIEEIGKGGMATVYRAYQPSVGRFVAIKLIHRAVANDERALERFRREARLIARLEHPHLLPLYDYDDLHEPPYIVMRYLEGGSLREVLEQGRLPLVDISFLMRQMGSVLDYAHRQGIIHRDIKPSNIMVDEDGHGFLMDFGIARLTASSSEGLTQTGFAVGTPGYMAPEQGMGLENIDYRADIYSLGVLVHQMLTGQMPYRATTPMAIVMKHINDPVPSARETDPSIPENLDRAVMRAMAKRPEDRFASAGEFVDEIVRTLDPTKQVNLRPESLRKASLVAVEDIRRRRAFHQADIDAIQRQFEQTRPQVTRAGSELPAKRPNSPPTAGAPPPPVAAPTPSPAPVVDPPTQITTASTGQPNVLTPAPAASGGDRLPGPPTPADQRVGPQGAPSAGKSRLPLIAGALAGLAALLILAMVVLGSRGGGASAETLTPSADGGTAIAVAMGQTAAAESTRIAAISATGTAQAAASDLTLTAALDETAAAQTQAGNGADASDTPASATDSPTIPPTATSEPATALPASITPQPTEVSSTDTARPPTSTETPTASPTETPTSTMTSSMTPTPSPTETFTPTATETATPTPTPTPAPTLTNTPTSTNTLAPTSTLRPTRTASPTLTVTPSLTPSPTRTLAPTATLIPTHTPTALASPTATPLPFVPTDALTYEFDAAPLFRESGFDPAVRLVDGTTFQWISSTEATLYLPLQSAYDLLVSIDVLSEAKVGIADKVRLSAGGHELHVTRYPLDRGVLRLIARIPADALVKGGEFTPLTIALDRIFSPREVNGVPDDRRLGLALDQMTIRPTGQRFEMDELFASESGLGVVALTEDGRTVRSLEAASVEFDVSLNAPRPRYFEMKVNRGAQPEQLADLLLAVNGQPITWLPLQTLDDGYLYSALIPDGLITGAPVQVALTSLDGAATGLAVDWLSFRTYDDAWVTSQALEGPTGWHTPDLTVDGPLVWMSLPQASFTFTFPFQYDALVTVNVVDAMPRGALQSLRVVVDGQPVDHLTAQINEQTESGIVRLLVPRSMITPGEPVTVTFQIDRTETVCEARPQVTYCSRDPRQLGLGVRAIRVQPSIPAVDLASVQLATTGWSHPETNDAGVKTTWIDEPAAQAILHLPIPADYLLRFEVADAVVPEVLASMTVRVNGALLPLVPAPGGSAVSGDLFAYVPRDVIDNDAPTVLQVSLDAVYSLCELGLGNCGVGDTRDFGVELAGISATPIDGLVDFSGVLNSMVGWSDPEPGNAPSVPLAQRFRWMDAESAGVTLWAPHEPAHLYLYIPNAQAEALASLEVYLDGVLVATAGEVEQTEIGRRLVIAVEGDGADTSPYRTLRLELRVAQTVRPSDIDPNSTDTRTLAIALNRALLVPDVIPAALTEQELAPGTPANA